MTTNDPEWQKAYHKEWYARNRENRLKQIKNYKKAAREWYRKYKEGLQCTVCGEDESVCLDFHHLRDKDKTLTSMIKGGYSIPKMEKEIAKCVVLCSNCHRKVHAGIINLPE